MKASSMMTFVIITFLGFVFLGFIIFISYKYFSNAEKNLKDQQARQIAFYIISEITSMYQKGLSTSSPSNQSVILLEKMLNLPEKIAGEQYQIQLISSNGLWSSIKINDTIKEEVYSGKLLIVVGKEKYYFNLPNIPVVLQGKADYETAKLSYKRYKIGDETRDAIILGNYDVIIDLIRLQ